MGGGSVSGRCGRRIFRQPCEVSRRDGKSERGESELDRGCKSNREIWGRRGRGGRCTVVFRQGLGNLPLAT